MEVKLAAPRHSRYLEWLGSLCSCRANVSNHQWDHDFVNRTGRLPTGVTHRAVFVRLRPSRLKCLEAISNTAQMQVKQHACSCRAALVFRG